MDQEQQSRWRPTRRQAQWGAAIVVVLALYLVAGYGFRWEWTGLVKGFPGKTIWDWLELLIVPAVLAAGGLWFSMQQREREQQVANERVQDETLQEYLDRILQMSADLRKSQHEAQSRDSLRGMRTHTLTVLPKLDSDRKARVVLSLHELGLIGKTEPVIDLTGADIREVNFDDTRLEEINLTSANLRSASLRGTDLEGADLTYTKLEYADLSPARVYYRADVDYYLMPTTLIGAQLIGTRFDHANLRHAALQNAVLNHANLTDANLESANLEGATMAQANLENANLKDATLPDTDLTTANFKGVTMPNGQKYEEWIKTPDGQDWLRTYRKNLGEYRKSFSMDWYEGWIRTTEGQMWLKAVKEDGENHGPS